VLLLVCQPHAMNMNLCPTCMALVTVAAQSNDLCIRVSFVLAWCCTDSCLYKFTFRSPKLGGTWQAIARRRTLLVLIVAVHTLILTSGVIVALPVSVIVTRLASAD
jgi:hypothetical protein